MLNSLKIVVILFFILNFQTEEKVKISFKDYDNKIIKSYKLELNCNPTEYPYHYFINSKKYLKPNKNGFVLMSKNKFFKNFLNNLCQNDSVFLVFTKDKTVKFFKIPISNIDSTFILK